MYSPRARVGILLLVVLSLSGIVALASSPTPLGLVITPTPSNLTLNIWTDKTSYTIGESATIYFNVNQPAYVYIYDIQPDGITRLIFPNAYSQSNYVGPGTHTLPDGIFSICRCSTAGQLILTSTNLPHGSLCPVNLFMKRA